MRSFPGLFGFPSPFGGLQSYYGQPYPQPSLPLFDTQATTNSAAPAAPKPKNFFDLIPPPPAVPPIFPSVSPSSYFAGNIFGSEGLFPHHWGDPGSPSDADVADRPGYDLQGLTSGLSVPTHANPFSVDPSTFAPDAPGGASASGTPGGTNRGTQKSFPSTIAKSSQQFAQPPSPQQSILADAATDSADEQNVPSDEKIALSVVSPISNDLVDPKRSQVDQANPAWNDGGSIASDAQPASSIPGASYANLKIGGISSGPIPFITDEERRTYFYNRSTDTLREIDPTNTELLSSPNTDEPPTWDDVRRINQKIQRIVKEQGLDLEPHHTLARQFYDKGKFLDIPIDDYVIWLTKGEHRLRKDDGLHTGSENWNKLWKNFFDHVENPSKEEVFAFLELLLRALSRRR